MPMTPEDAQKLSNLSRRVLTNTAAGKASSDGISQEELAEALDILRGDRATSMNAAAKKTKVKKEKAEGSPGSTLSLEEKLRAKGLSAD